MKNLNIAATCIIGVDCIYCCTYDKIQHSSTMTCYCKQCSFAKFTVKLLGA